MTSLRAPLCLLLSLGSALSGAAVDDPVPILPGSRAVKPRATPPHTATYVLHQGAGGPAVQEIRREVRKGRRSGRGVIELSWHTQVMGREIVDRLVLDARTLAPLERTIPLPTGGIAQLEIEGTRVHGELLDDAGAPTEPVDVRFDTPLHDASLPLLLALPLEEGARFRIPTLPPALPSPGEPGAGEGEATPAWIELTVAGRGPFELEDGVELDAWTLELATADGPTTRLWLADEAPFVLRKEVSFPGMGELVWRLKDVGDD